MADSNNTADDNAPELAALDPNIGTRRPVKLADLPNDVLVLIFEATRDFRWVLRTFPCVCRAWRDLYRTRNARPLHETLVIRPDVDSAAGAVKFALTFQEEIKTLHVSAGPDAHVNEFRDFALEDLGTLSSVLARSCDWRTIHERKQAEAQSSKGKGK